MGRDKDKSVRKAKPAANSQSAAAMVAAMGGTGISFASFDPNAESLESDIDSDIAVALKKLTKRDATTKIKALTDLASLFDGNEGHSEEDLVSALPKWQQCFSTVSADVDRRVREGTFVAHKALVTKVKKVLGKHIRPMMMPWLKALFDPETMVRSAAKAAFTAAFPPNKVAEAFVYCKQDILEGVDETIRHTVQTMCDPKLFSKEEAEEMYERTVSSTLLALAHVFNTITPEQGAVYCSGRDAFLDLPAFWKLSSHASVLVRAAWYSLIRAMSTAAPALIHDPADPAKGRLKVAAAAVLGAFGDKESAGHEQLWECVLVLVKVFPGAWSCVNLPKAILPRLSAFIRAGGYGSAAISFPCLLPLLQLYQQGTDPATRLDLHTPILESLWAAALAAPSPSRSSFLPPVSPADAPAGTRGGSCAEGTKGAVVGQGEAAVKALTECWMHGLVSLSRAGQVEAAGRLAQQHLSAPLAAVLAREEPPAGRQALARLLVETLEAAVEHPVLQPLRAELQRLVLEALLFSSRPAFMCNQHAAAAGETVDEAAEAAGRAAGFMCSFSGGKGPAGPLFPVAAALCAVAAQALVDCLGRGGEASGETRRAGFNGLRLVGALVRCWGPLVVDSASDAAAAAGISVKGPLCAERLARDVLLPLVAEAVTPSETHVSDVLGAAEAEVVSAAIEVLLGLALAAGADARDVVWPALLRLVLPHTEGGLDSPAARCLRLEALAMLFQRLPAAATTAGAAGIKTLACQELDDTVCAAAHALCFRPAASGSAAADGPELLERHRLLHVLQHALSDDVAGSSQPCAAPASQQDGRGEGGVVSASGLSRVATYVVTFLTAAAERRVEVQVEASAAALNEESGGAVLDLAQRLLGLYSCLSLGQDAAPRRVVVGALCDAVLTLTCHSDQDPAAAGRWVGYSHVGAESAGLRSSIGARAVDVWAAAARPARLELLRLGKDEQDTCQEWVMAACRGVDAALAEATSAMRALVLADQAAEILSLARLSAPHPAAAATARNALLSRSGAWAKLGPAGRGVWLKFVMRLAFRCGAGAVLCGQGAVEEAAEGGADMADGEGWVLVQVALAYVVAAGGVCRAVDDGAGVGGEAGGSGGMMWHGADNHTDGGGHVEGDQEDVMEREASWQQGEVGTAEMGGFWRKEAWPLLSLPHALPRLRALLRTAFDRIVAGEEEAWARLLVACVAAAPRRTALDLAQMLLSRAAQVCPPPAAGKMLPGPALAAAAAVETAVALVREAERGVEAVSVGGRVLYCCGAGGEGEQVAVEEVEVRGVHREVCPPFYTIRLSDGRERQTEASRLLPLLLPSPSSPSDGETPAELARALQAVRRLLGGVLTLCAGHVMALSTRRAAEAEEAATCSALAALAVACEYRQHSLISLPAGTAGSGEAWLEVIKCTCKWYSNAPAATLKLPSPESIYMLAASPPAAALPVAAGTGESGIERRVAAYWLAQLRAAPDGTCARAVSGSGAAWSALAGQVLLWLVSSRPDPVAAVVHVHAIRILATCAAYAVEAAGGGASSEGLAVGDEKPEAEEQVEEVQEVAEMDEIDEIEEIEEIEEVEEVEQVEDVEEGGAGGVKEQAGRAGAETAWERCRVSGYAQVLGELLAARSWPALLAASAATAAEPATEKYWAAAHGGGWRVAVVHAAAAAAEWTPTEVLERRLVHLVDGRRRERLVEALYGLLAAPDVAVQVAAFRLLTRVTGTKALLPQLDALRWEHYRPDRELDDPGPGPSSPAPPHSPHSSPAAAAAGGGGREEGGEDYLRAVPAALMPLLTGEHMPACAAPVIGSPSTPAAAAAAAAAAAEESVVMSTEALGLLLAWRLALDLRTRSSARLQANLAGLVRQRDLLPLPLHIALAHVCLRLPADPTAAAAAAGSLRCGGLDRLPDLAKLTGGREGTWRAGEGGGGGGEEEVLEGMEQLGGHVLLSAVEAFPALARQWFNALDRSSAARLERLAAARMTPILLAREVALVQAASAQQDQLEIRASLAAREITASYVKDEASLEMVLRLPAAYPLRPVEVDGTKRLGVSEGTWRKWLLGMRTLLDSRDGSLVDAVLLWKRNVDKVFEGVEECPICYTVIHLANGSLPRLACHTCRNKFHSACLYKWFQTSNKSTCPLCQSPWYS